MNKKYFVQNMNMLTLCNVSSSILHFLNGRWVYGLSIMITSSSRGVRPMIMFDNKGEGVEKLPKTNYVICERSLGEVINGHCSKKQWDQDWCIKGRGLYVLSMIRVQWDADWSINGHGVYILSMVRARYRTSLSIAKREQRPEAVSSADLQHEQLLDVSPKACEPSSVNKLQYKA